MPGESQKSPEDKPDPTVRAQENLKEAVDGLEKLFQSEIDRVVEIHANDMKHNDDRLDRIEAQRKEHKQDAETSIQSALKAQKELSKEQADSAQKANDKTEANVIGLINQQKETYTAETAAQRREHDALKERVGKLENVKLGGQQAYSAVYVAVGAAIGLLGLVAAVLVAVLKP